MTAAEQAAADPATDADAQAAGPPISVDPAVPPRRARKRRSGCWTVVGVLLGLLLGAGLFGFRPLLHHLVKDNAREQGIAIALGEVHLGWSEVRLEHFRFAPLGLPGVEGRVEALTVQLDGFAPTAVEARGVQLSFSGSAATLAMGFSEWTKNHPRLLRLPAKAEYVDVSWRPTAREEPWLQIKNAAIEPSPEGGNFVAAHAEVMGVRLGKVGASWTGDLSHIDLGFGQEDLARAPVTIEVEYAAAEPRATIRLRPTRLERLAAPLGVALPIEGVSASGTTELRFRADPTVGPIHGTLQGTFEGYTPPVPREVSAFVFGKTTELETELEVSVDRKRVVLRQTKVKHGAFKLSGSGLITRHDDHATIVLALEGHLRCTDVADAAARARLGQGLGSLVGSAAKLTLKGSVGVRLEIDASTRDLSKATIKQHIGLGCGLKSLADLPLPDLSKLPIPDLRDVLPRPK